MLMCWGAFVNRNSNHEPQTATSEASGQLRLHEALKNELPVRSVRALAITKSIGQNLYFPGYAVFERSYKPETCKIRAGQVKF